MVHVHRASWILGRRRYSWSLNQIVALLVRAEIAVYIQPTAL